MSKLNYKTNRQLIRKLSTLDDMELCVLREGLVRFSESCKKTTLEKLTKEMEANGTAMMIHPTTVLNTWVKVYEILKFR